MRPPLTISTDSVAFLEEESSLRNEIKVEAGLHRGLRLHYETAPRLRGEFKEAVLELMRTTARGVTSTARKSSSNPGGNYNGHIDFTSRTVWSMSWCVLTFQRSNPIIRSVRKSSSYD